MNKTLANHNADKPHTHKVTVVVTVNADSNQHAEMNGLESKFKDVISVTSEEYHG